MNKNLIPKKIFTSTEDVDTMINKLHFVDATVNVDEWTADTDLFYTTIIHNLNANHLSVDVFNRDLKQSMLSAFTVVDANTIKVFNDTKVNCSVGVTKLG